MINVYISSAEQDKELRNKLILYLAPLKQKQVISIWHRDNIEPGLTIETEWSTRLSKAHIVLLLVSPYFYSSDDCQSEKQKAMEILSNRTIRIIPIVLRKCRWDKDVLYTLQALPRSKKPVFSFKKEDEPFAEIAEEIESTVKEIGIEVRRAEEIGIEEQEDGDEQKIISLDQLRFSLRQLNYRPQNEVFQHFLGEEPRIGAFFIHGEPAHGQAWLLNRLLYQLPSNEQIKAKVVKIPLKAHSQEISLPSIWKELANVVNVEKFPPLHEAKDGNPLWETTQKEILEKFQKLWQTQTTILIVSRIDELKEALFNKFVQDFWYPLVNMARTKLSQPPLEKGLTSHYLLLFLVDEHDHVDKWKLQPTEPFDQPQTSVRPVKFKKLSKFSRKDVDSWLQWQQLSTPLWHKELTTQKILDNGENGLPEPVLVYVCEIFKYDLYQDLITINI